eukprot:3661722-Prymnesium_polylepis.1
MYALRHKLTRNRAPNAQNLDPKPNEQPAHTMLRAAPHCARLRNRIGRATTSIRPSQRNAVFCERAACSRVSHCTAICVRHAGATTEG